MPNHSNRSTATETREESPKQPMVVASKPSEDQERLAQERAWQLEAKRRAAYVALFNPCGLY